MDNEIQLFICEAGKKQKPITISTDRTVQSITDHIGNYDKWAYAGKMPRDDQTICQYNITDGATIFTSADSMADVVKSTK